MIERCGVALWTASALAVACAGPVEREPAAAPATTEPAAPEAEPVRDDWRRATAPGGRYELAWRPADGEIPRNEEVELELRLELDGRPCPGVRVAVRGWMPDHGHGLVREPLVADLGDGRYRVEGLLLHMRGHWQVIFDVGEGAERDALVFDVEL